MPIKPLIAVFYRCQDKGEIFMQNNSCDSGNLLKSHSIWRTQLTIALAHHDILDAKMIYQKDACRVGKWLHNLKTHQQLCHLQSYLDCLKKHEVFHQEAGKIADLVNAQEYEAAMEELTESDSDFNRASDEIALAVSNLLYELDHLGILPESKTES